MAVEVQKCYLREMVSSFGSPGTTALRPRNCPRPSSLQEDTQDITGRLQNELGWGLLESKADKQHLLPFQGLGGITMTLTLVSLSLSSLSFSLSLLRQPALL